VAKVMIAMAMTAVAAMAKTMAAMGTATALWWWRLWQCWWWGRGSAMTMVEEVVTAAAEEADDGQDKQRLCSDFNFNLIFFSPSLQPILNAKAMVRSPAARHILGLLSLLLSLMHRRPYQRCYCPCHHRLLPCRCSFSRHHRRHRCQHFFRWPF
jgi:hypothetical protein